MTTPTIQYFALLGATWTDISAYVLDPGAMGSMGTGAHWGMSSNEETDRVAETGEMTFFLNNTDGLFDPGLATALAGWEEGTKIVFKVTFDGNEYIKFYGAVDSLMLNDPSIYIHSIKVLVLDWLAYISKYPMKTVAIQTHKTGDEGITSIVAGLPAVASDIYDTGVYEFDALFDTVTTNTTARMEINKIAVSEGGYFYRRNDKTLGDQLVFENATHRNGLLTPAMLPISIELSNTLTDENGDILTDENGDTLVEDRFEVAKFTGLNVDTNGWSRDRGNNVINRIKVSAYPKTIDTSPQVLYSLGSPMFIGSMQTITFTGRYVGVGGLPCNAISDTMIAPVATTDYTMNTASDGTGTDITANLAVTVVYGTEAPTYTVINSSAYPGYITKLNARGYGVYQNNSLYIDVVDSLSQTAYGVKDLVLDQQYQRDTYAGGILANKIIAYEKDPRNRVNGITMIANKSDKNWLAFLSLDIGDVIQLTETSLNIDGYFYIHGVSFTVGPGGVITFKWILKVLLTLGMGLSAVSCTFTPGSEDALCFGNVPALIDLPKMTLHAWIYPTQQAGGVIMSGWVTGVGGIELSIRNTSTIGIIRIHTGGGGQWLTTATVPQNEWSSIDVTIDETLAIPKVYINGSAVEVLVRTEVSPPYDGTPIGAVGSINGMDWCVGNIHGQSASVQYSLPFPGKIKDAKVFNRVLSSNEVSAIYGGEPINSGLVFRSPSVPTNQYTSFINKTLSSTDRLLDDIFGAVGFPHDAPVSGTP